MMRERMARPLTTGRALAIVLVTALALGVGNLVFTSYLFRSLCGVIGAQVEVYRAVPPSTPTGQYAEREWTRLRRLICRE